MLGPSTPADNECQELPMTTVWPRLVGYIYGDRGQGLVEYALLLGLIALVAIAAVTTFGQTIVNRLYGLGTSF